MDAMTSGQREFVKGLRNPEPAPARPVTDPYTEAEIKARALFGRDVPEDIPEPPSGIVPFASSFLSAATKEQIGIGASDYVKRYRDSSWGGTISQVAGALTPVVATAGLFPPIAALEAIPLLGRGLTAARALEAANHPILGAAIKGAYSLVPFDAARIVGAGAFGDPGAVGSVASEAGIDLVAGGLIGAGGRLIREIRPGASVFDKKLSTGERIRLHVPEFDPNDIPQLRHSKLRQLKISENMPDDLRANLESDVKAAIDDANIEIVSQLPGRKVRGGELKPGKYIRSLEDKTSNTRAASDLNAFWTPGPTKGLGRTKQLLVDPKYGMASTAEVEKALEKWAPPDGWQGEVQFPRLLIAEKNSAKAIRESLSNPNGLTKVDNGLWIGKEKNGLYAVIQRLPTKPGEQAEYMLFKTHNPNKFYPALAKDPVERTAMLVTDEKLRAPEVAESRAYTQLLRDLKKTPAPLGGDIPAAEAPRFETWARENLPRGINGVREDLQRIGGGMLRPLKAVLAPITHQLGQSPEHVWMMNLARKQYDQAMETAFEQFYGKKSLLASKSLFGALIENPEYSAAINAAFNEAKAAGPEAWTQLNRALLGSIPYDIAKKEGMHPAVLNVLRKLGRLDGTLTKQQIATDIATETAAEQRFIELENQRLVSRLFVGDWRSAVVTEKGDIVGYGAGKFSDSAKQEALKLAERSNKLALEEGRATKYSIQPTFQSSRDIDRELVGKLIRNPEETNHFRKALITEYGLKRYNPRTGALGYLGDIREMTLQEAKDNVLGNLIDTHMHMTQQSILHGLKSEIDKLAGANPALGRQFNVRLLALRGKKSELNKQIDDGVDQFLAPIFGANVAMRFFRTTNMIQHGLTLGFGDIGYPVVNVTSVLTQMIPEINNIVHAPQASLAKYYSFHLINGERKIHSLGVIDNMKFLREVFRDIANPSPELREAVDKALRQHHINPKFVEEVAGSGVLDIQKALKEGDYAKFLWRLSLFPGAKSEELARLIGFVGGWKAGNEFMGHTGEKAYDFAVQMLRKSMYGYSTADRPRIITGSFGGGFGLFKNWGMSYIANMVEFAGQGALHGNWKPFMWQMATGAAVGGVGGTPLVLIANGLSKAMTDKSFLENTYNYFGAREDVEGLIGKTAATKVADVFYSGLPTLSGITLQNRATLPGTDPFRDITQLSSVMLFDRMSRFGEGVKKGLAYSEATGKSPVHDRETMDAFAMALAPRSLQRMMSITEDGAIRSMRNGNVLVGPMSFVEKYMFFLGILPLDVAKGYEVADMYKGDEDKKMAAVSAAGEALAYANKRGDHKGAYDILLRSLLHELNVPSVLRAERIVSRNIGESRLAQQQDAINRARMRNMGISK